MREVCYAPVTVKHRIGIDHQECYVATPINHHGETESPRRYISSASFSSLDRNRYLVPSVEQDDGDC